MLSCTCSREYLNRRSTARLRRASSSMSMSHSRVAATVRFLLAASVRILSSCWLIAGIFSCSSFCSRRVMGVFLGRKNESIVGQQRKWIGDQIVQPWITQVNRWLLTARALLLAQDVGHRGALWVRRRRHGRRRLLRQQPPRPRVRIDGSVRATRRSAETGSDQCLPDRADTPRGGPANKDHRGKP